MCASSCFKILLQLQIDGRDIDLIGESQGGRDISECVDHPCAAMQCLNGGTCMVESSGFTCMCPLGYAGDTCNITGELTTCNLSQ